MNPIATEFLPMALLLLTWHALADYPLQGDFLARGKNRHAPIDGIPADLCMRAHCWIHAGGVLVITGSVVCALIEHVLHWAIDDAKCGGHTSFRTDQRLHVACKVAYAAICGSWLP